MMLFAEQQVNALTFARKCWMISAFHDDCESRTSLHMCALLNV